MGKTKVFPLPNPVAAKNDGSLEQEIVQGYRKLRVLRENCKWYMLCPLKEYYDRGMLDRKWVELYCAGDWESCVRFKKEESGEPHPDNMLPDGSVDEKLGAL